MKKEISKDCKVISWKLILINYTYLGMIFHIQYIFY